MHTSSVIIFMYSIFIIVAIYMSHDKTCHIISKARS